MGNTVAVDSNISSLDKLSNIPVIPIDMWIIILKYIGNYNDGIQLSSTCKKLYELKFDCEYNFDGSRINLNQEKNKVSFLRDYFFAESLNATLLKNLYIYNMKPDGIITNIPKSELIGILIKIQHYHIHGHVSEVFIANESVVIEHGNFRQIFFSKLQPTFIMNLLIPVKNFTSEYYLEKNTNLTIKVYEDTAHLNDFVKLSKFNMEKRFLAFYYTKIIYSTNNLFNNLFGK